MKYKYEDLEKIMKKLNAHSKKGDIEISVDQRTHALTFQYTSNVDTETEIAAFPSELAKFVTVSEVKWLVV